MKIFPCTILGAALLSACANQSGGGATSTAVVSLESLYLAGAAAAQVYEAMPNADPHVVATLKTAENIAFNTLQPLVAAVQSGAAPDAVTLAAAQAAISALQAALPVTAAANAAPAVATAIPAPSTPVPPAGTAPAPAANVISGAVK